MKKIKKLLAMIMAMTMVLGMAISVSAAPSTDASIEIKGLTENDNTKIHVLPVVLWDSENNSWQKQEWFDEDFVDLEAHTADWNALYSAALGEIDTENPNLTTNETIAKIEGLDIGMYIVLAFGDTTDYEVMGVKTYTYEGTNLIGPLKADIYAKGSDYPLDKTFTTEDQDKIVGYGDIIHYVITTTFPSFDEESQDKEFWIKDTPSGLSIQEITVKVDDVELTKGSDYTLDTTVPAKLNEAVTVKFTDTYIGTTNDHVGASVEIEVAAKVETTGTYTNTATSNKGTDETPGVSKDTGSMVITKVDETGTNILTGATFVIKDSEGTELSFVSTGSTDEYRPALAGERGDTELTVGENGTTKGKIKIVGLKEGTYSIEEIKAPNGYAKLPAPIEKEIKNGEDTVHLEFNVQNSKLASLPSTGGIGTTIFTIGGCAIMIAAAALYFVNRRKSEEN